METSDKTKITAAKALVLSAGGSPGAYDIVRALGLAEIPSLVASSQRNDIAFYSRYCRGRLVLPPFEDAYDRDILQTLLSYAARLDGRPVLFYASDAELSFVWRHREALLPSYRFLLPPNGLLECIFNKASFVDFAADQNLPTPASWHVRNPRDLSRALASITFPCIVKPAFSQDWIWDTDEQREQFGPYKKALRRFASAGDLMDFCRALPERSAGFVIQSYIDGRDEVITSFHGYFDEQSRCLGYFVGRKVRTYPPHTGGSTYIQTVDEPALAVSSIRMLTQIGFQGVVKIDYKWDNQEKKYQILEINPRYNLWEVLGAYAGVNLVALAYDHQRGALVHPRAGLAREARLLYLKQDLRAFVTGYRLTGEWSWWSYVKSLVRRKQYFRVFDLHDPSPFLHSVISFFKRNLRVGMIQRSQVQERDINCRVVSNPLQHES